MRPCFFNILLEAFRLFLFSFQYIYLSKVGTYMVLKNKANFHQLFTYINPLSIPGKEASPSMCLLSIFTLTKSSDNTTNAAVKNGMATQVVNIREYIDSLYLKSMLRNDLNRSKRRSTASRPIEQRPKSLAGSKESDSPNLARNLSPTRSFAGQEGKLLPQPAFLQNPDPLRHIFDFRMTWNS